MCAEKTIHIKCHSCGRMSVLRGAANNQRVQFVCEHCGHMASFSVKHVRESHGARAFADDAQ
jgi:uncharacterized Zn finger protein